MHTIAEAMGHMATGQLPERHPLSLSGGVALITE